MWYTIFSLIISIVLVMLLVFLIKTHRSTQKTQAWLIKEENLSRKRENNKKELSEF